jgi:type IV secretion system protein TrbJ
MSTPSSTPIPMPRSRRNRLSAAIVVALALCAGSEPEPAHAQQIVFDPRNHLENALQAARQAQSLSNEARMLLNQARALAASPYSHLGETAQALQDIAALAREVRGVAADAEDVQRQFEDLYPTALDGLSPERALQQANARNANARDTAQDLARTAAELERLAMARGGRLQGALSASERAEGQTAAIQSSTQVLAVLAEDLGSIRTILMAQSRLMAEATARDAAERAAAAEARRRFWGRQSTTPAAPSFNPLPNARN